MGNYPIFAYETIDIYKAEKIGAKEGV